MIAAIFISYMALLNSVISSPEPLFPIDGTAGGPAPVNGVWALEKADCETPTSLDLTTWPKCATPLGFVDDEVAALERPGPGKKATADNYYSIAPHPLSGSRPQWPGGAMQGPTPASPAIVQIDVALLLSHTFVYLALQPLDADATGKFTKASAWAAACPTTAIPGRDAAGTAMRGLHHGWPARRRRVRRRRPRRRVSAVSRRRGRIAARCGPILDRPRGAPARLTSRFGRSGGA